MLRRGGALTNRFVDLACAMPFRVWQTGYEQVNLCGVKWRPNIGMGHVAMMHVTMFLLYWRSLQKRNSVGDT